MTNKWIMAAMAGAVSLAFAPAAFAQAPVKIAYVNSQRILAEAPGRAQAESTYNREVTAARAQLQRMDDSLKTMVASYEKDAPALDSVRRDARGKAIRDREAEFSQRAQDLNNQMQQRQADLAKPLLDEVTQVLKDLRKQNGYAMIFDVGSNPSSVVAADESLDITDLVLARLKQLGPPKAGVTGPVGPTQKPAGISGQRP